GDIGRSHLLDQPDDPLDRRAAPDDVVEFPLLIEQPSQAVQFRNVGEEEYLALGGARVVLDLDLHDRIAGPAIREAGHDLPPARWRRSQERLDGVAGVT